MNRLRLISLVGALFILMGSPVVAQTAPISAGPKVTRLTTDQRAELLKEHSYWRVVEKPESMTRTIYFKDFSSAFAFMTLVGLEAQRLDHHPDWSNSWNKVELSLTTTDIGGLSSRDAELAAIIDKAAVDLGGSDQPPAIP